MQLMTLILSILLLSGCTSSVTESKKEEAAQTAESLVPVDCLDGEECFCELPNGTRVADQATINMFSTQRASCVSSCSQQQVEVRCNKGKFELIPGYSYLSCEESECNACELPWGEELAEGASLEVYQQQSVGCKDSCRRSTVRCSGGRLVGANLSSYPYPTCQVQECIQCTTPWGDLIDDGAYVRMFKEDEVACGNRCESQNMRCVSGEFDAALLVEYNHQTCSAEPCLKCNAPWGQVLNNNQQVTAFRNETVPCGESCADNGNMAPRACVDGVLIGSTAHNFGSCNPANCEDGGGAPGFVCRVPWSGLTMLAGTQVTAYSKSAVSCNESCDDH
ncbi:MAG: hypothetical protein AAF202_12480, partial [Pseudomonadota bacterium]